MSDSKFLTFSESDAPVHITKCLNYFFDDGRNKYTFSDAYLKYSKFADENFISTKRLFNIIRSTSLVSDQIIFRQQTTSGFLYFIDVKFFKLAERHHRQISRRQSTLRSRPPSPKSNAGNSDSDSTIIEITTHTDASKRPEKESSIGSLSIGDTWEDTSNKNKNKKNKNTRMSTPEKPSPPRNPVPTSVTNLEEIMDNEITDTMVEICTPTKPKASEHLSNDIQLFIRTEVSEQLKQQSSPRHNKLYVDEIRQAHAFIDKFEEEYKTSAYVEDMKLFQPKRWKIRWMER